jgi:hypothetical protein
MSELDKIVHLQGLLDQANRYTVYLKEQIKILEGGSEMYRRVAERRHDQIMDLEEEIATLRENLDNLESKIAGRACAGNQNCGFDYE